MRKGGGFCLKDSLSRAASALLLSSRFVEEIYSGSIRGGSGLRGLRESAC